MAATVLPSIAKLRGQFAGKVIAPGDADYDKARAVFYGDIDRRPAVIIRPVNSKEVANVVTLAIESGVTLSVRSGGHSPAGHSVNDGGIVLDLRDMRAIDIDVAVGTAWVEAGATASEYAKAADVHDLVTGFGDTGSVGIGGITTSGGIGYLVRKHGLAIDNLLAAEIVTADGRILHADERTEPDLFWAIRGGGGNFGVVTRFHFRLRPLAEAYGGILILPATAETIAKFMTLAEAAPEELSAICNVMNAPPMPFLPAEVHGKLVVMALVFFAGDAKSGEKEVAPFRSLAKPLADMVRPIRYPTMFEGEPEDYHPKAIGHTMFMNNVDERLAQTILDDIAGSDAPLRVAQLRVLGGAMARVPADATAFAHRASRIMANVASFYDGPDDKPRRQAWVDALAAKLHQSDDGAYVGFLAHDSVARARSAYPAATWGRLARVKKRYDPSNLFRLNTNIAPTP